MPEPIEVLLVDDQRLMRDGLRTLLELEPDLQIVGEVTDGAQAVEAYGALKPHVVLMDVRMPNMDGVEATRRIRQQWPQARILILTTFDDDAYVFEGIRAGAMGYLLKDVSGEELAAAIRTIAGGGALMGPEVAQRVMRQLAQMMPPGTGRNQPGTARSPLRTGAGGFALDGPGIEQPGDRPPAAPGGRYGEELRQQRPAKDRHPRPHTGRAEGAVVGVVVAQPARPLPRPNWPIQIGGIRIESRSNKDVTDYFLE